jgi:putative ABC transport system ATP-binding protein
MNEPSVAVCGLTHSFGEGEASKQVLQDCTLDLMPGEVVMMSGPSGSGKTTLLTLMGALRSVQQGSVRVLGRELAGLERAALVAVRRSIGFIFQGHNLLDALSARENVNMAIECGAFDPAERDRRVAEMLCELGLADRFDYKPAALSGGQKQRVAIARALVNCPRLILADEPTAALDGESGRAVIELLQRHAARDGATVLIVTHDSRILDAADRIVNMVDGRIVSNVAVRRTAAVIEALRRTPAFADYPLDLLVEFAQRMRPERFSAGEVVVHQGESDRSIHLIVSGTMDVEVEEDGRCRHIELLAAGDLFGEDTLLTGRPHKATVTAREPAEVFALDQGDLEEPLRRSRSLVEQLRDILARRI